MVKGKGVSSGIGFGNIVVLKKSERKIEKKTIENEQVEHELERLVVNRNSEYKYIPNTLDINVSNSNGFVLE